MSNVKFLYDNCTFYCFCNSFRLDLVTTNFVRILPCYTDVFCRIQAVAMLIGFCWSPSFADPFIENYYGKLLPSIVQAHMQKISFIC